MKNVLAANLKQQAERAAAGRAASRSTSARAGSDLQRFVGLALHDATTRVSNKVPQTTSK